MVISCEVFFVSKGHRGNFPNGWDIKVLVKYLLCKLRTRVSSLKEILSFFVISCF